MVNVKIVRGYVVGMIGDITRLHTDYYHHNWGLGLDLEADVAQDVAAFLRRYDEQRDGIWSVIQQKQVVATIIIDGSAESEGEARLRYFIVGDMLRGKGVGRKLMEAAIRFCDEKQFKRVYLKTFAGLDAARHLYESFGFVLHHQTHGEKLIDLYFERKRATQ